MKAVFRVVSVLIIFPLLLGGTVSLGAEAAGPDYIFMNFCDEEEVTEYVNILKDDDEENGSAYSISDVASRNTSGGFGLFLHVADAAFPTVSIKFDDALDLSKYPYARVCMSYNQQTAYTGSFDAWIKYDGAAEASKLATVVSSGTNKEVKDKDGVSCEQRGIYRRSYSFLSFTTEQMESVPDSHKLIFSPADAGENAVNCDIIIKYIGLFKTAEDAENFDPSVKSITYTNGENKFSAELDLFNYTATIDMPDGEITPETLSLDNLEITLLDGRCTKAESDISDTFNLKYEIQSLEQKHEDNEYKKEIWEIKINCTPIDDTYMNNLINKLNGLTIDFSDEILADFGDGLAKLVAGYAGLTENEKTNLAKILTSYAGKYTLDNYADIISGELFYAKIRACDTAEAFENLIEGTELQTSDVSKIFLNKLKGEERETVFNMAKNELSYESFCTELVKKSFLLGVSMKEGYGIIKELFEDNLAVIGYDSTSYNEVCAKTDNIASAYKMLTLQQFDSIDGLKEAFEAAVTAVGKKTPSRNSGGGGAVISKAKPSNAPVTVSDSVPVTDTPSGGAKNDGFKDLEGYDWAKPSIEELYQKGIISGRGNGSFAPGDSITREEFVQMIVKAFDINEKSKVEFVDVEADKWYYDAISKAVGAGIISGISEKEFGTGKNIIRKDMAVIAENVLKKMGKIEEETDSSDFGDDEDIAGYAKKAVATLKQMGLINGSNGRFEPKRDMTRAEATIIVTALMNVREAR